MMRKDYLEYYPNRMAKAHDYLAAKDDSKAFYAKHLGPKKFSKFIHQGKECVSYSHDNSQMSLAEQRLGSLISSDFNHWWGWWRGGRNIFDFSEGMLEMLRNTDVSELEVMNIIAPFEHIYMDLSAANIPFEEGQPYRVEGVFVHQLDPREMDEEDKSERSLFFTFVGEHIGNFDAIRDVLCDGGDIRSFHLGGHDYQTGVRQTVGQTAHESVEWLSFIEGVAPELKAEIEAIHRSFIDRTLALAVNCLLYLSLTEREVTSVELGPKLPQELERKVHKATTRARLKAVQAEVKALGFTRVNYVGESIPKRNDLVNATGESMAPHWRRGHWRNQRHGPAASEKRLIWIKPVIVNKQAGEPEKGRIYAVDKSPKTASSAA